MTAHDNAAFAGPGTMLLRLAHLFAVGEDSVLSQPATVDLATLFSGIELTACTQMSLTANQKVGPCYMEHGA